MEKESIVEQVSRRLLQASLPGASKVEIEAVAKELTKIGARQLTAQEIHALVARLQKNMVIPD
ncbi:MAG: hypothetical protein JXA67_20195 [Micromonosporaceae bacterium]|nr:hypothetical protein [Micromonosporaceae bacterium]